MLNRIKGALYGLVVGDVLGAINEFTQSTNTIVKDIIAPKVHEFPPGTWTDDTTMMLCLIDSINLAGRVDLNSQLFFYKKWLHHGWRTTDGTLVDVGGRTQRALKYAIETGKILEDDENSAGNGPLIRLAPVPLFYLKNPQLAIKMAEAQCITTHTHPLCRLASKIVALHIIELINSRNKDVIYKIPSLIEKYKLDIAIPKELEFLNDLTKIPYITNPSPYVVSTLQVALDAFVKHDTFEEGLIDVVNRCGDSDSTGAVFGQLAGAFYGYNNIPKRWISKIRNLSSIRSVLDEFALKCWRRATSI